MYINLAANVEASLKFIKDMVDSHAPYEDISGIIEFYQGHLRAQSWEDERYHADWRNCRVICDGIGPATGVKECDK